MKSLLEFAESLSPEIKWHGNHNENARNSILNAGHLSMVYENGNLRYISIGNCEVIRMIYSAVRDKEWLTINPAITGEKIEIHPDSFRIEYHCLYRSGEINFLARYLIEGHPDNTLFFSFEGEALDTFEKSRIGFCVLHPVEGYSGESCIIRHSNDEMEILKFPLFISTPEPFSDIKSMKWNVSDHNCTLDFFGDVFETEDQRNWTDASYKTYCTPQSLPCPVTIQKGEKISQRIEFKAEGEVTRKKGGKDVVKITIYPEQTSALPLIGIGRSTRPEPITEEEVSLLKKLKFDHYRVDLYLFSSDWRSKAELAVREAAKLMYSLEIALFLDHNALSQSADFIDWVSALHLDISMIILFHKTESSTPDLLTDKTAPLFKEALPRVKIGCGTNANFAQLNRNRPESLHSDYICYSIHPQEHATDNTTLVENLRAQEYTVKSAMQFANGKEIWISPVNIQRRFNANIENYEQPISGVDFPPQADSRLMSLFAACWTVGSLKYLSEAGVKGMTFFETVGERGIFQGDFPSRWPETFPSIKEMLFPLFFVFNYLLRNKSFKVVRSKSSHPLKVDGLILSNGEESKLIIVNYTLLKQKVFCQEFEGDIIINQLNADSFSTAVCNENWLDMTASIKVSVKNVIILEPFSVNFIDKNYKV